MSHPINSQRRQRIRASLPQVCVYCGETENLTLDHIIPRVYGGTNARHNLQILCLPCNLLKGRYEIRYRDPWTNTQIGRLLAIVLRQPGPPSTS